MLPPWLHFILNTSHHGKVQLPHQGEWQKMQGSPNCCPASKRMETQAIRIHLARPSQGRWRQSAWVAWHTCTVLRSCQNNCWSGINLGSETTEMATGSAPSQSHHMRFHILARREHEHASLGLRQVAVLKPVLQACTCTSEAEM